MNMNEWSCKLQDVLNVLARPDHYLAQFLPLPPVGGDPVDRLRGLRGALDTVGADFTLLNPFAAAVNRFADPGVQQTALRILQTLDAGVAELLESGIVDPTRPALASSLIPTHLFRVETPRDPVLAGAFMVLIPFVAIPPSCPLSIDSCPLVDGERSLVLGWGTYDIQGSKKPRRWYDMGIALQLSRPRRFEQDRVAREAAEALERERLWKLAQWEVSPEGQNAAMRARLEKLESQLAAEQ